jgi:branched-chain amino acid transport system substrate-binding protein
MELAADYGVPHMGALGAAEITTDKYKDDLDKYRGYWMKGWATPRKLTVGYADCIEDAIQRGLWKPANKKMAIYGEDADWGRDVGAAFRRTFTELGWEVVSEDYSALGQTEFYPLVSKFKASDVSLIAGSMGHPPMVSAFLKQAHEVRLKAVIISDGLGWVGEWYKLTGAASDHVIDMNPRWATEAAKKFAAEMKEQYGYDPGPASTGIPYDCANHFIKVCRRALEKYGKLDKESIHKVIFDEVCTGNLNYTAEEGALIAKGYRYSLDTYNDPVVARDAFYFPVLQYMKGKSHIVYPEDWKETDLAVRQ